MSDDDPASSDAKAPPLGMRKMAHELYQELKETEAQRDRFAELGKQLVVELKSCREERDFALKQLETLEALPAVEVSKYVAEREAEANK